MNRQPWNPRNPLRTARPIWPADVPWERASQHCLCDRCGRVYGRHPYGRVAGTFEPGSIEGGLYLTRLCSGLFVKL